jgi:hypothetical protein
MFVCGTRDERNGCSMSDRQASDKIIGDLRARIDALEKMIGEKPLDRRLTKRQVAEREGVSARTVDRRTNDPKSGFPQPIIDHGRCFWWLSELEAHDAERLRKSPMKMKVANRERAALARAAISSKRAA